MEVLCLLEIGSLGANYRFHPLYATCFTVGPRKSLGPPHFCAVSPIFCSSELTYGRMEEAGGGRVV